MSYIYTGYISHSREGEKNNTFKYPTYTYAFDLDELEKMQITLFGYNRFNIVSLWDQDYLLDEQGSIKTKLIKILASQGIDGVDKVVLVTSPRLLNYIFNPMSCYYCFDKDQKMKCVVVEVNNTFRDKHIYIADQLLTPLPDGFIGHFKFYKAFHVSPFYNMKGEYECLLGDINQNLNIHIRFKNENNAVLHAHLFSNSKKLLNTQNLIKTLLKYPITAWLTMPRILFQAAKLYYIKKLSVNTRPYPTHEMTVRIKPPTFRQKMYMKKVLNKFKTLEYGSLTLINPDKHVFTLGDPKYNPIEIKIKDYLFYSRILFFGTSGLNVSPCCNYWESDNRMGVIDLLEKNYHSSHLLFSFLSWPKALYYRFLSLLYY
jgi:cyclopropane-fatty-acyl-phospholipid synthase